MKRQCRPKRSTSDKISNVCKPRKTHPVSRTLILKLYDDGWTVNEISSGLNASRDLVATVVANTLKRTA